MPNSSFLAAREWALEHAAGYRRRIEKAEMQRLEAKLAGSLHL
jgi:hypothetical protein